MKRFILRNADVVATALNFIRAININPDELVEVVVKPYKRNRSLEQNDTYWMIITDIGNELGYTKNDMHEFFMREYLPPRSIEVNGKVIEAYSTRELKVGEMKDYLDRIIQWAAEHGIQHRRPEDYGRAA
jgi:hypothetical protein